jgi:hypothetical protein
VIPNNNSNDLAAYSFTGARPFNLFHGENTLQLKFPPRVEDDPHNTESLDMPPLLVRVSDGTTTQIVSMPLEAALFLVRNRLCSVVGDVTVQPDAFIDDEAAEAVFAAAGL